MTRLLGRHATVDILLRRQCDVFVYLLIEIVQQPFPLYAHLRFSVGCSIRAMASANFSHLPVSTASCFRPFAVKR
jgi:hypothetical protein